MKTMFTLQETPFPLVMQEIVKDSFTGIVFVSSDAWKKGLIFKGGGLCAIQSNRTEELLGNILVEMGLISAEENERSLARSRTERRKQGVILLEMGLVQSRDINEALAVQTEKRFLDIFSWEEGLVQVVP
ncbi:MAG TPA: hypothetical protein PLQ43_12530, partial [Deltaproteobacteria bacterium]|nr:hypothetical protein [Deltaproteobacteria bacterium]